MIDRQLNKGLWKVIASLRQVSVASHVPRDEIIGIAKELETLVKAHHVYNLDLIPSREFAGTILHIMNNPIFGSKGKRRKKDEQFRKSLSFWIRLAQRLKREPERSIAKSLGLSAKELVGLKEELREKGWFD